MEGLPLYLSVPVAGFRAPHAREYWESFPCPPPATVYGMLLSLVGEPDRLAHRGAEVALALIGEPDRSTVLRTLWRIKDVKSGPGQGSNARPDFQELLTGVRLLVWVRSGAQEAAEVPLAARVKETLESPAQTRRFGGLSLGESTHLVDELRWAQPAELGEGLLLLNETDGDLSLPVWPDHVGARGTAWGRFQLRTMGLGEIPEQAWTCIQPLS